MSGLVATAALPPEVEGDRQIMAATTAMKANDWNAAINAFAAAEATGVKTPEAFDYLYGMALHNAGQHQRAVERLGNYLKRYGKKGAYYKEALEQFNSAEKAQTEALQAAEAEAAKLVADKVTARKKHEEALAQYERDVENCPTLFRERVEEARRNYRKADQACIRTISPGGNFCDEHEARNTRYVNVGATADRIRARERLETITSTSSAAWCANRYTRPSLPAILAEDARRQTEAAAQKKHYRRWDRSKEPLLVCDRYIYTWIYHRLGQQTPRNFQCSCTADECKGSFEFDPKQSPNASFRSDDMTTPFGFEFRDSPF